MESKINNADVNDEDSYYKIFEIDSPNSVKQYICGICGSRCAGKEGLHNHVSVCHKKETRTWKLQKITIKTDQQHEKQGMNNIYLNKEITSELAKNAALSLQNKQSKIDITSVHEGKKSKCDIFGDNVKVGKSQKHSHFNLKIQNDLSYFQSIRLNLSFY